MGRMHFPSEISLRLSKREGHSAIGGRFGSASNSNSNSLNRHGLMLIEKGDVSTAVSVFLRAAEQENPYALFNLGVVHEYGMGVPKNMKKALLWYQKAAKQGSFMAKARLGMEFDLVEALCFEDMNSYLIASNGK